MRSTKAARVLLALGFLVASLAYGSWIANRTIFDPAETRGAANALLSAPSVRATLAHELQHALAPQLVKAADVAKLRTATDAAVADPRFTGAFARAIASLQAGLLSDRPGRITLDTHAVTAALDDALVRLDPKLAKHVNAAGPVRIAVGGKGLPHLGGAQRSVRKVGSIAAAIALLLIAGALLLAHNRKTIGRVGRRTALLALAPALMFAAAPRLLAARGAAGEVAAAILRVYGHRIMPSALALVAIGLTVWLMTIVLPRARPAESPDTPLATALATPLTTPAPATWPRAVTPRITAEPTPMREPERLSL